MIQRVYEQAKKSKILSAVFVATDDKRIEAHVKKFGGNVIMTSLNHKSGTDRCAEATKKMKAIILPTGIVQYCIIKENLQK